MWVNISSVGNLPSMQANANALNRGKWFDMRKSQESWENISLSFCPFALFARFPFCPFAPLPFCPFALLPFLFFFLFLRFCPFAVLLFLHLCYFVFNFLENCFCFLLFHCTYLISTFTFGRLFYLKIMQF